jgi:hypothetical protein
MITNVTYFGEGVTIDGVWIGVLDLLHLRTELVNTGNYNTIADFHIIDHYETLSLLNLH